MGDAWDGRIAGGSGNTVGDKLYRDMAGNRGTVGGATANTWSVCKVEGIRMRWVQEEGLVVTRGYRETTSVHLGINRVGV